MDPLLVHSGSCVSSLGNTPEILHMMAPHDVKGPRLVPRRVWPDWDQNTPLYYAVQRSKVNMRQRLRKRGWVDFCGFDQLTLVS
jgi:hypothetical protein